MLLVRSRWLRLLAGAFETTNFLVLKLWLRDRRRARMLASRMFREYVFIAGKDRWRACDVTDLLPAEGERRITIEHSPGDGIFTPIDELAYMALITRNLAPSAIFEIGTYRGRTALNFALNSPEDCKVYTLDLPVEGRDSAATRCHAPDAWIIKHSDTGLYYRGKDCAEKIQQLWGDSRKFDFSPYFGAIDLVFVDGAHDFETVLSDTKNALKLLRPGGVVLWHDFGLYGDYNDVTRAVMSLVSGNDVFQIGNTQLAYYRKPAAIKTAPVRADAHASAVA
jgi:predicted O-methyltransferase YrrM